MGKDFAYMIPASSTHHLTIIFANNITDNEKISIQKTYEQFVKDNVKPDAKGRYMLGYDSIMPWGKNSYSLTGPIAIFKDKLDLHMGKIYPGKFSIRKAHVDVKGKFDTVLYPAFNMMQYKN